MLVLPLGIDVEDEVREAAARLACDVHASQREAARKVRDHESEVLGEVLARVWESFEAHYADERWRQVMGLKPAVAYSSAFVVVSSNSEDAATSTIRIARVGASAT